MNFVIEVLGEDINLAEAKDSKHDGERPLCHGICITGGQKAYNEFHNVFEIAAKTHVRLWLFQSSTDGQCANFQLQLEAKRINLNKYELENLSQLRCEELDLPVSLNTHRYLGEA